ncbi:MarR family transcriptional regulator [bacterium]|nr:MarR family transcriptional regulator [bacterium]
MATSTDRQLSLDLWQAMLNAFLRLRQSIRPIFAAHDLTGPQWRVFRLLGEQRGPGLTPGQISEALHVTPGNITGVVDNLDEAGLVQRLPHPDDRRAQLIVFTPAGEALYRQVRPAFDKRVAELFACLEPEERRAMIAGLERLLAHADRVDPDAADRPCGTGAPR